MEDKIETFEFVDFGSDDWMDRPEYEMSPALGWQYILSLHTDEDNLIDHGRCGDSDYWYFLHEVGSGSARYWFYTYQTVSGLTLAEPCSVEPFMAILVTELDGVSEVYGPSCICGGLRGLAYALLWMRDYCATRWPPRDKWQIWDN